MIRYVTSLLRLGRRGRVKKRDWGGGKGEGEGEKKEGRGEGVDQLFQSVTRVSRS